MSSSAQPQSAPEASVASQPSTAKSHFNTGEPSDVVVLCGEDEYNVHNSVLSAHSKYFSIQLNGPWKESLDKTINITDFDPAVVEAMMDFMYGCEYEPSDIDFDIAVYQIADKYQIQALKDYAARKFKNTTFHYEWDPVSANFLELIQEVYDITPTDDRGLRGVVLEVLSRRLSLFLHLDEFHSMLESIPEFQSDLLDFGIRVIPRTKPESQDNNSSVESS